MSLRFQIGLFYCWFKFEILPSRPHRFLTFCKVSAMTQDKILILDFGSQVTQLIARRVREAHVYCELHSFDMPLEEIKAFNPKGIILSGGPNSVYESDYQAEYRYF